MTIRIHVQNVDTVLELEFGIPHPYRTTDELANETWLLQNWIYSVSANHGIVIGDDEISRFLCYVSSID